MAACAPATALTPTIAPEVEVASLQPCAASAREAAPPAPAECTTKLTGIVDLNHDGRRDCVRWTRCGPDEPTPLVDGGIGLPRDVVFVVGADGRGSVTLYDNRQLVQAERFEELSVLRFRGEERLLMRAAGYGTGNVQNWSVVDVVDGVPRRWSEPPLDAVVAPLLSSTERLGKHQGRGVDVRSGALEVTHLVVRVH